MKFYLIIVLIPVFVSLSLGQRKPFISSEKTKTFGSSLEKYKNKKQRDLRENQKSEEFDNGEVIRIKTDLVINDVLVMDQNGSVITELEKDDFIVTENGASQTIEVFSLGENSSIPRSILLIIDDWGYQASYLKNSVKAAKVLVDKLNPKDKMAIVTVNVKLRVDFTSDKILLKKTLDALERKGVEFGSGAEFDALLAVLNEMFTAKDHRPIVIFQGNGNQIIWLQTDEDAPYPVSNSLRQNSAINYTAKVK